MPEAICPQQQLDQQQRIQHAQEQGGGIQAIEPGTDRHTRSGE
jgi:hypothetical protein